MLAHRAQWGKSSPVKSLQELPASQQQSRATAAGPAGWGKSSLTGAARTARNSTDSTLTLCRLCNLQSAGWALAYRVETSYLPQSNSMAVENSIFAALKFIGCSLASKKSSLDTPKSLLFAFLVYQNFIPCSPNVSRVHYKLF